MRIRAVHIILLLLALTTMFMVYVTLRVRDDLPTDADYDGLAPPMDMAMEDAPEIALETEALTLGVIPHDRDTHVEVTVHNRGRRPLEIREVRSSCPLCTVGRFEPGANRIAPGASSVMTVTVKPDGVLGFHTFKTLTLMTNDPRTPQAQLTVEAHIDPEFTLEPDGFDFGQVGKGVPAQREALLRQRIATPITLQAVSLRPRDGDDEAHAPVTFDFSLLPESQWTEPGKREYRIVATLSRYARPGDFRFPVFIRTDVERFPHYHVFAQGEIYAPYTLELDGVGETLVLRGEFPEGRITVRAEEAVAASDIQSEQDVIIWRVESPRPDTVILVCEPGPDVGRGIHKDALLFYVALAGERYPERIPVHVYALGTPARTSGEDN